MVFATRPTHITRAMDAKPPSSSPSTSPLQTLRRMVAEGATPLVWLVAAGLLGLFAFLAEEVLEGEVHAIDEAILLALRNPAERSDPIGPAWLEEAARDITSLGSFSVLFLVTAVVVLYLLILRRHASVALLVVSIAGGAILNTALKMGFDRPRPDLVPHEARTFTASFPSGHAMMAAVTFLVIGALLARVQPRRRLRVFVMGVAVGLAMLVGATRVYLGVHWPSDVVAGWTVGSAWALVCWLVLSRFEPRGAPVNRGSVPSD